VGFWRGFRQPARYAVLVSGGIPVLAFPAANLEFLAWIGLIPGLALMRAAPAGREAAARGWWFGAGYLLAAMYWLAPNLGPGLLLVAIVLGALWSAVGLAVWSLLRPPVTAAKAAAALIVVPSSWLVTEWIRSWQGIGGPWAVLGASQWQHPAVLALAAAGGVWLISFALVAANTGLLIAIVARTPVIRLAGLGAAILAALAGPAAFALTAPPAVTGSLTIALVQPGLTSGPAARLARSEQLTGAAAGQADLYVWGESSVGYNLAAEPSMLAALEHLAGTAGAEILVNQDAATPRGKTKQATLIASTGIKGRYVKTRLVPFGEYIPFRSALGWLTSISRAAAQNVVTGTGAHVVQVTLPDGRPLTIGVLICFESAFPDMSRVDTGHGARVIIYQTSDSTFQASWAPAQHAALSAVRAAETGRPVVQAALTGDSAAFDDRGRTLAWKGTSYSGTALVRLALPPASARTLFDRLGDYVPWTAVAITALAAITGLTRSRRRRRTVPAAPGSPAGMLSDLR
jgi:apolipoprotein N-acyltransferase